MTVHLIELTGQSHNVPPGTELTDHVSTWCVDDVQVDPDEAEFVLPDGRRYGLGISGPTSIHNENFGRRVQRVYAFLYGLPSVISAHPQTRVLQIKISAGDFLVDPWTGYLLQVGPIRDRFDAPALAVLHAPDATADRSAHLAAIRERDAAGAGR